MEQGSNEKDSTELRIERSEDIHSLRDPDQGKTEEEILALVRLLCNA